MSIDIALMWSSRSPGVAGAVTAPVQFDEWRQLRRLRTGEQPVPGIGSDRRDHRKALSESRKPNGAKPARTCRRRIMDGGLTAFVDGDH